MDEFDRAPVPPHALQPARYFAASYAGEHVAGTEFVIGAMFVGWGVGAADVILGLVIGNTLAVLSWALLCAPVATSTRLTLYAYLERIAGPSFIKLYSVVNGVFMCVLAGAMITVSASAVRILFGIPPQVAWYPTSLTFVLVALAVGAVVSVVAVKGFSVVARFAEVSAPWMISIFFVGALAMWPLLAASTPNATGPLDLAETSVWIDQGTNMGMWHVVAIAWGANLAFHGAFGDMTILRFARRTAYGWFSAIGMFIGHFAAWLAAGVMGAGAALLLRQPLTGLDAGEVAYQALGAVGILAVVIAGWTTSNPTIYRAGLAFQSLNPAWSRTKVTALVGVATTIIACFPFVFTGLLSFLGLMALVLAPTGGIIAAEHFLFPKLGLSRYWSHAKGQALNPPAVITWAAALALAAVLGFGMGVHILFLFVPAWITALLLYPVLASQMGAKLPAPTPTLIAIEEEDARRRAAERTFDATPRTGGQRSALGTGLLIVAGGAIAAGVAIALRADDADSLAGIHQALIWPTALYFVAALTWALRSERAREPE